MAQVTLRGNPVKVQGELPAVGKTAPAFTLTGADLQEKSLADYVGKKIVLSISPSLDTGVCAAAARRFNEEMSNRSNTVVLYITADLPFAQKRFCGAEGLENVITLSTFRNPGFGEAYGVRILDGPMAGLMTRSVLVLDESGKVVHRELVPEITQEPDYDAAMTHV